MNLFHKRARALTLAFLFLTAANVFGQGFSCTSSTTISITGSGNTQIIAAVTDQLVRICHISLSFDANSDFSIREGTGTDCGTNDIALTGTYLDINSIALDFGAVGALRNSASQALCLNFGSSVNAGGVITYAQF